MTSVIKVIVISLITLSMSIDTNCSTHQFPNSAYSSHQHLGLQNHIVKELLRFYNKDVRPGSSEQPVTIEVNIYIRMINFYDGVENGNIASMISSFTFREVWMDNRLNYSSHLDGHIRDRATVPKFVYIHREDIWFPDTFIQNEYDSKPIVRDKHERMIRVNTEDGKVLMSQRLQHRFICPVNLYWYPFEKAVCTIDLASYSYSEDDIKFVWKAANPIQLKYGLSMMPQFQLDAITTTTCTSKTNTGTYGCLRAIFHLSRHSGGKHVFELFFCPGLLVSLSWVGFLLPHWKKQGIGLLVIVFLVFIITVGTTYYNFPQARYSFVHTWISGCGYFITAEVIFLVLLKLADDFQQSQSPPRLAPFQYHQSKTGGGRTLPIGQFDMGEGGHQGIEKEGEVLISNEANRGQTSDRWVKLARMLALVIFFLSFLIFAIVIRARIPNN